MAIQIEEPIYYAVEFNEDSTCVKSYESLPEKGYAIEIAPNEENRGNGYYPTRFFIDGKLTHWGTEDLEIININTSYNWQDLNLSFEIQDNKGNRSYLNGKHSRFNLEEGIVSLMQRWNFCRKFHFADTIRVFQDFDYLARNNQDKWIEEWKFLSLKKDCMKLDEYIKSTILACLENGYVTDIEYLQQVRNELKDKLWDIHLKSENKK